MSRLDDYIHAITLYDRRSDLLAAKTIETFWVQERFTEINEHICTIKRFDAITDEGLVKEMCEITEGNFLNHLLSCSHMLNCQSESSVPAAPAANPTC